MDLKAKIIHGWDISAKGYSENVVQDDFVEPGKSIWTNLILEKAPRAGALKILDVGTGPGVFATNLSLAGHEVTAIDFSAAMLKEARKNSAQYGANPDYLLMDSENLTFPENTFDMIVARN
ncbi:MAG: class I SAM-dependent methyltransferase, partial [Burkholderiaceae bacterium]|nr:class I SAM-dependent methyltransferase [Burkholderiaceae bacterium]